MPRCSGTGRSMTHTKTERLRSLARAEGLAVHPGFVQEVDGRVIRTDTERVTELRGPSGSLTFEEDEYGALWCADELSVEQAVAAARGWT